MLYLYNDNAQWYV